MASGLICDGSLSGEQCASLEGRNVCGAKALFFLVVKCAWSHKIVLFEKLCRISTAYGKNRLFIIRKIFIVRKRVYEDVLIC